MESRSRSSSVSIPSPITHHHHSFGNAGHLRRKHEISKTIKELTSTKKRLSDSNLTTNETIEFFTKIKNRRFKSGTLVKHPSFNKYKTYTPYDRSKLLQRINSFNILNWSVESNNTDLNPLTCARYGWSCVENNGSLKNQIKCHTCDATLIIKLQESRDIASDEEEDHDLFDFDEELDDEINKGLVNHYLEQLITGHGDSCPWRNHPTPLSSYLIQSYDSDTIVPQLKKTYDHLNKNKESLECVTFCKRLDATDLAKLQKLTAHEYDDVVLMVGLFGWELKVQTFGFNQLVFLQCHCCNRRILVQNVQGGDIRAHDLTLNLSPSKILTGTVYPPAFEQDDADEEDGSDIDVLNEHRDWCAVRKGYKTIIQFV